MNKRLTYKAAVITGAAGGMETVRMIKSDGGEAIFVRTDVLPDRYTF